MNRLFTIRFFALFLIAFTCFHNASAQPDSVSIGLFPSCLDTLEVRLLPDADFNGIVANCQFTIRWDSACDVNLGSIIQFPPEQSYISMQKSGGEIDSNGFRYQIFFGTGSLPMSSFGESWTAGTEVVLMQVPVLNGCCDFEIINDSWTANLFNNGDFYVALGGSNKTGTIYTGPVFVCDSVLHINRDTTICQGDSIFLGGAYRYNPGTYYDSLTTTEGCDSIVITNLSILISGCTNASATNYNPLAVCDDASCAFDSVDIVLYKIAPDILEVRVVPRFDFDQIVSNVQFTIRWDSACDVNLGSVIQFSPEQIYIPMQKGSSEIDTNGYRYQIFSGTGNFMMSTFGANWTADTEVVLMQIPVLNGCCNFEIINDSWTSQLAVNGSFFLSLNGNDRTGGIISHSTSLQGWVMDANGDPLTTGLVQFLDISYPTHGYKTLGWDTINLDGSYSVPVLDECEVLIRAIPDSATYPGLIPTYAGNVIAWPLADTFFYQDLIPPDTIQCVKVDSQIQTGTGINVIKGSVITDIQINQRVEPIEAEDIILNDIPPGAPIAYNQTDPSGYFQFSNLDDGLYELVVEVPGIPMDGITNFITLGNGMITEVIADVDSNIIIVTVISPIACNIKVFLGGPFDEGNGLMKDGLRSNGMLPLTDPYDSIFTHYGSGGGEAIDVSVLAVSDTNNAIVDWVFVELRDKTDSTSIITTRSALIQRDGDIVDVDGVSTLFFNGLYADEYYIAIRHRNHLAVMTANPVWLTPEPTDIDFTNPSTATYGTNAQYNKIGTMIMWPGEVKRDGVIKYSGANNDRDLILLKIGGVVPTNVVLGYYSEDVSLDGVVKYSGLHNDRDLILRTIGGSIPTATVVEQLPE